jgi:PA domain
MRPSFLSLRILPAIICALGTTLVAQLPVAPRLQKGFNAIEEHDLRSNLTFIAGNGLEGRMSLQPGDDAAAEWVASEFAKAGLEPAAAEDSGKPSFLQAVPLIEYKPDPSATALSLSRQGDAQQQWRAPEVTSTFRNNVDAAGGLVYVGYGITAPELGYDDFANVDVRGKIVLLMEHEPQENDPTSIFNGTGNTRYAISRVKLSNAQRHGAVAVLLMPEPNATHVSSAKRLANILAGVTAKRLTSIPLQAIANDEVGIAVMTVPLGVVDELLRNSGVTAKELQTSIDRDLKAHSLELAGIELHLNDRAASSHC